MKITEHLQQAQKPLFSFEILPLLKNNNIQAVFAGVEPLLEFQPKFVSVTYHHRLCDAAGKAGLRKRPGTAGICAAIQHKFGLDVVPHIVCSGFSKDEIENTLIDLNFLGIENLLLLRGDPLQTGGPFQPYPLGHAHASELVQQVAAMNRGHYLSACASHLPASNFCMGVGGYPEKHPEAPDAETDLQYLKQKTAAGAEFIITQTFYDNQKYFKFVARCRAAGIQVPIIPGLMPLTGASHIANLPRSFQVSLPPELVQELDKCNSENEIKQVGLEWTVAQSRELLQQGIPGLHFFTMGKPNMIKTIAEQVF